MAVDIDSLQIEIEATSSDAAAKIDALATALTNLKAAAKGGKRVFCVPDSDSEDHPEQYWAGGVQSKGSQKFRRSRDWNQLHPS